MYDFFIEYQKQLKFSDKLSFLSSQYNNEKCVDKKTAITCLIEIEQNDFSPNSNVIVDFHETELRKIIANSNNCWWGNLTLGLINLRKKKLNKYSCDETVNLFKLVQDAFGDTPPSFLLFFQAHAFFEKSKVQTTKDDAIHSITQASTAIEKLENEYSGLLINNDNYHALVMNLHGNISLKENSLIRQDDLLRDTKEDFFIAEQYYLKAITFDQSFAYPYNGLGNIYRERFDYIRAIYYYNKAIKCNNEFMYPWNFLGDCFRIFEEYDVALKCYSKALELCNKFDKNRALPLYGIGRVYYELGKINNFDDKYIKRAEFYFNKAESCIGENIPSARFILMDKAKILEKRENYDKAKEYFERIRDNNLFFKQKYYQQIIDKYISECNDLSSIREICKNSLNACSVQTSDLLKRIMCEIDKYGLEKRASDMKELFDMEFLRRHKISEIEYEDIKTQCMENKYLSNFFNNDHSNRDCFQVLRRWNSYTPIINSGRGGGYFLKIDGIGIVIDPGFNFMKNYKESKNYFRDIDVVLISHAHDDHTADMESILNMQYRYNKQLETVSLKREIAKEYGISAGDIDQYIKGNDVYSDKFNNIIKKRFNARKKKIVAYMSPGTEIKFSSLFENDKKRTKKAAGSDSYKTIIKKNKESSESFFYKTISLGDKIEISDNCKITAIKAIHNDLIENQQCLGFLFDLPSLMIVYTGDTGWYRKEKEKGGTVLPEESLASDYLSIYNQAQEQNKKIILVAHLGGFKGNEINFWRQNNKEMFYDNHLGRIGLYEAVRTLKPEVCIVSEFGEEFNGMRKKLTDIYTQAFANENPSTVFLPGDIGLTLNLDSSSSQNSNQSKLIKVIRDIDFKNRIMKYEYADPCDVSVGEYRFKNQLFFYNKNSKISEGDIVQASIDGFLDESEIFEISV